MSTPQIPAVRRKQKARRTKQLAAWRQKHPATEAAPAPAAAAQAAPAKSAKKSA